jgi:hypothetical protein
VNALFADFLSWLRDVCGLLWAVAAFASILFAVIAFSLPRDRRVEQSLNAKFEDEIGKMYNVMEL